MGFELVKDFWHVANEFLDVKASQDMFSLHMRW